MPRLTGNRLTCPRPAARRIRGWPPGYATRLAGHGTLARPGTQATPATRATRATWSAAAGHARARPASDATWTWPLAQLAMGKGSMKKIVGVTLALLAGSGLAAALLTSANSAAAAPRLPVAYDCQGTHHGQIRPGEILLDCLSGDVIVKTPAWGYWTGTSARSRNATLWVNTCRPNCAAGHYRKYPATLLVYRVRSVHGRGYYTRMRLAYSHNGPRKYTYHWGTFPGATIPGWIGGP